jgi:hypothetical protein
MTLEDNGPAQKSGCTTAEVKRITQLSAFRKRTAIFCMGTVDSGLTKFNAGLNSVHRTIFQLMYGINGRGFIILFIISDV